MGIRVAYSCNFLGPLGPLMTKESYLELGDSDTWAMSGIFRHESLSSPFPGAYFPEGVGNS